MGVKSFQPADFCRILLVYKCQRKRTIYKPVKVLDDQYRKRPPTKPFILPQIPRLEPASWLLSRVSLNKNHFIDRKPNELVKTTFLGHYRVSYALLARLREQTLRALTFCNIL